ncbi:hypothetical protein Salat_2357000 [Sesamum alatum]|uniref:Uncharacterized protein n=1 Tax=Sesamum alatum TaxID=300844 RepID=A0AAE1XWR8_9LAMI|nr:hypothetical protein Salat_2357000 [Sesamum alatum]
MDAIHAPPHSKGPPLLRRWNSISTSVVLVPTKLNRNSSTTTSDDLQLLSIKPPAHSYSSLKDILPSVAVNSPQPKAAQPGPDICIRNRLVKQAAWAYLQPTMSSSLGSTGGNFFHRLWTRFASVIDFFVSNVVRALDGTLCLIRIRSSTLQRSNMCSL